jgi:putative endonuclease
MKKMGCMYIMGNKKPTLYVGVTSDPVKRVYSHKEYKVDGFTKKYKLTKLLYYEIYEDIISAIEREKQVKNWRREWKLNLIKSKNPDLKDLYSELLGE